MNSVHLMGIMGKDKKIETTPTQKTVCTFTMGIKSMRKDKNTGTYLVDWFHCEAWGSIAERIFYSIEAKQLFVIQGHMYNKRYTWDKKVFDRDIVVVDCVYFTDPLKARKNYNYNLNTGHAMADNAASNEEDGYTIDDSNGNTDIENLPW